MNNDEVWANCGECGAELKEDDKVCPKCGSTRKAFYRGASVAVGVAVVETKGRQKRKGFRKFMKEMISRRRVSGDSNSPKGVHEERIIDKEKKEYHQIVRNAETGEILHEEHEPLSKHKGH